MTLHDYIKERIALGDEEVQLRNLPWYNRANIQSVFALTVTKSHSPNCR